MAQSLYTLDNITYVAGRHYVHDGVNYEPGDVVAGAREFRNVESMVRSRHLIPVVRNLNDVPVYYQKDVKVAALVEEKLKFSIKWDDEAPEEPQEAPAEPVEEPADEDGAEEVAEPAAGFDPADYTIPEVIAHVEEHPEELEALIEAEEAGKDRSTLLDQLYTRLAAREGL